MIKDEAFSVVKVVRLNNSGLFFQTQAVFYDYFTLQQKQKVWTRVTRRDECFLFCTVKRKLLEEFLALLGLWYRIYQRRQKLGGLLELMRHFLIQHLKLCIYCSPKMFLPLQTT